MEFREFSNPEERDYDINSSLNDDNYSSNSQRVQDTNKYYMQLFFTINSVPIVNLNKCCTFVCFSI